MRASWNNECDRQEKGVWKGVMRCGMGQSVFVLLLMLADHKRARQKDYNRVRLQCA
jgi:hypothetical protein